MSRRKDVPDICGAICALSEKLETLWQRTYDAVKTVNNVQPDGNNNLTVQAGTGIVINPITNGLEIECNVDPQGIETVNGVAADANENVDLVAGTGIAITPDAYNNEIEIACNIDVSGKVDKITAGSGDAAYTHNGATQGEIAISKVNTGDTIAQRDAQGELTATTPPSTDNGTSVATTKWVKDAIGATGDVNPTADTLLRRDGSGKAFGADPANGATDKTLVTANWVSQTGDSSPNNIVHKSGNETVNGTKTIEDIINVNSLNNRCVTAYGYGIDNTECWWKFFEKINVSWHKGSFIHVYDLNAHTYSIFYIAGYGTGAGGQSAFKLMGSFEADRVRVTRKDSTVSVFIQTTSSTNRPYAWITFDLNGVSATPHANVPAFTAVTPTVSTEPVVGNDYDAVITPTVIQ